MKKIKKYSIILGLAALIGACDQYELPEIQQPTAGTSLDLTKLVSVGNSLTAGFMNGALYTAGQKNSYPSIMAKQFALVGGGTFNQPDINSTNGYYGISGTTVLGRLKLKIINGSPAPSPLIPGEAPGAYTGDKTKLNNFGVPGVTLQTAQLPQLGGPSTGNPVFNALYARFASNPGTSTLIGDAKAALANGGTFFTFWLGNNDVLGYATGGASNPAILTSQANFSARLSTALTEMLNGNANAEGAVANIPDVTTIPFFTTIPYNPVNFTSAQTANVTALNNAFAGYNTVLNALKGAPFNYSAASVDARKVTYKVGANPVLITDESLNNYADEFDALLNAGAITSAQRDGLRPYEQVRQATASDLIVLPAASFIGTLVGGNPQFVNGVSIALADQWVLVPSEQTEIQTAVTGFNASIASAVAAQSSRLVLVDANAALKDLKAGKVSINNSALTASITPPFGAFSLDGVHPNARGSAYIANLFISAINAKWSSTIPLCNPNDYNGNELPTP